MRPIAPSSEDVPVAALLPFVLLTFGIAWGILGAYLVAPTATEALFGPLDGTHPAFVLAVWAPAIAAVVLVAWRGGWNGLRAYFGRLTLWRCPPGWALFLALGVPLVFIVGAAIKGTLAGPDLSQPAALFAALAFMTILGPVEELGWRGFAQPLLQRVMPPLAAGLVIGATWGLWHLPAFLLAGTVQSGWSYGPFFVGNVALAVIATALFNAARGSILLPAIFHYQLINPLWPDAQPWDSWLFLAVAVAAVWLHRDTMLTREGAVTAVIPGARRPGQ